MSKVNYISFMDSSHYLIASHYFIRFLGLVYFFVFFPFLFQIRGLIGKNGILPIELFLKSVKERLGVKSYQILPTLFWFSSSDRTLMGIVLLGTILSLALFLGFYPPLLLIILYVLYLSIVSAGQDFLSFGWELFLLEITCNAFFLSLTPVPNPLIWFSINLLLFRFHFQAGAVKIQSKDINWRNLTSLSYHYLSQPLPNTQAFYFHKLPLWFHKFSCFLMFFIELVVPFAIFGSDLMRFIAFFPLISLQFFIWFTGNFSYLNHLTAIFCFLLISDTYLISFLAIPQTSTSFSYPLDIFISLASICLITFQLLRLYNHFARIPSIQKLLDKVAPFHIANRYGIFAIMTTKRYEIVVEGSQNGAEWKEYCFKYKPSELNRRPRRISPYQPRLDWQAWFLPFTSFQQELWVQNFLIRLLQGKKEVLSLLRINPFSDSPPKFIRILLYDYTFTDWETKKKTKRWWERKLLGHYSPTLEISKE